jgi:diguanylate cyclase (GGDEF)-like protein
LISHILAAADHQRPLGDVAEDASWLLDRATAYRIARLPSEAEWRRRAEDAIEQARISQTHGSGIARFAIDHFETVNKVHGYLTGNRVLSALVDIILQLKSDDDFVVRLGGDEFAILRPIVELGATGEHAPELLVAKICQALHDHPLRVGTPDGPLLIGQIGVAAAIATFPSDGDDLGILLNHTHSGLRKIKQVGRATVLAEVRDRSM